ncbi:MAG: ribonuclease P protein component [Sphingobacteriales bacterium]|jgi:ribonuclease P protein component
MERLRQRADFLAAASGIKVPSSAFVLQARDRRDQGPARLGFTVSKKVGNAVERNRVRRRLREIVRLSAATRLRAGHDYVLIGRRAALNLPFARITQDFEGALRRVHAGRSGNTEFR